MLLHEQPYLAEESHPSHLLPPPCILQVQQDTPPLVVWKMKAPEKKPLVRREAPEEVRAKVEKYRIPDAVYKIFSSTNNCR